ncbi:uncharacterized protein EV422DRAFT_409268 [Fimicolochytrium jonesii]|uniref:uncharacterized protein n=1 Tax=Fimicolochytrium jonesii TaxID=1396493 RepID=UPI0022FE5F0B|nr:uncharacterized protein EV422DRAFT_409268 [Fimicolochytrium jonesii]KAI8822669.1 hypothetical protein EV422DRAFT_409268 [Fimicolochytrium jonesii]
MHNSVSNRERKKMPHGGGCRGERRGVQKWGPRFAPPTQMRGAMRTPIGPLSKTKREKNKPEKPPSHFLPSNSGLITVSAPPNSFLTPSTSLTPFAPTSSLNSNSPGALATARLCPCAWPPISSSDIIHGFAGTGSVRAWDGPEESEEDAKEGFDLVTWCFVAFCALVGFFFLTWVVGFVGEMVEPELVELLELVEVDPDVSVELGLDDVCESRRWVPGL